MRMSRHRGLVRLSRLIRNQAADIVRLSLFDGYEGPYNGEFRVLDSLAPNCSTAFDVGSNVGHWSARFLASCQPSARLWAFEPASAALGELQRRFQGEARLIVEPLALSDFIGLSSFSERIGANHEQSSFSPSSGGDPARQINVQVTTLDAYCRDRGVERIDFLKVDAEGHDFRVLAGGRDLLEAGRVRFVQFEYESHWRRGGSTLRAALDLLTAAGFRIRVVRADGLHAFDYEFYDEFFGFCNFFAFRAEDEGLVQAGLVR